MNEPTHSKHTMNKELLFPGLDVHAQNIAPAFAEGGGGEARNYGAIPNDLRALEKVFPNCAPRIRLWSAPTCRRFRGRGDLSPVAG
jgi:hypothetical protein